MACFFIGTPWDDEGIAGNFRTIAAELAARGHQVVILTDAQAARQAVSAKNLIVCGWPSPRPTRLRDFLFLYRLIRRYRPDGLIANFGAGNVMMLVGWLLRVPQRIIWYRTLLAQLRADSDLPEWKFRLLVKRKSLIYRLATWVIANSVSSQTDVQQSYGVPAPRTTYFYNFMPDPRPLFPAEPGADSRYAKILCVARLDFSKGQDVLVRALARLRMEFPELAVEFIGDGPLRADLIELARKLDVLDRCHFRGRVMYRDVLARMSQASFTVVPSRNEAFGRVVLESLSVATPVIASNVGGIPEIVRDGVDGWLIPPDDPAALADRMARLLRDPDARRTMSANARQRFLSTFEQSVNRDRVANWLETQVP